MRRDRQSNSDVLYHGHSRKETNRTPTQTKVEISRRQERNVTSCMEHQNQGLFVSSPLASCDTAHKLAYIRSTYVVNSWNLHIAALHSTRDGQPFRCPVPYSHHNFSPIGSCASHRRCCSTHLRAKPEGKLKCNIKYI
jgi:hypothetical protein